MYEKVFNKLMGEVGDKVILTDTVAGSIPKEVPFTLTLIEAVDSSILRVNLYSPTGAIAGMCLASLKPSPRDRERFLQVALHYLRANELYFDRELLEKIVTAYNKGAGVKDSITVRGVVTNVQGSSAWVEVDGETFSAKRGDFPLKVGTQVEVLIQREITMNGAMVTHRHIYGMQL